MTEQIKPKLLVSLIKAADQTKTKTQSIAGEFGERVKNAIDNEHLHRSAFTMVAKLYRMDEEKRSDFLRAFPLYLDVCEREGLFGEVHTGDMLEPDAAEADREAAERNTQALNGIRQLEDDEGPGDYAKGERVPAGARRRGRGLPGGNAPGSYKPAN